MVRRTLLVTALCGLVCRAAYAQNEFEIDLHGYGGWAYGNTSDNIYLGGTPDGSYDRADFALNIAAVVTEKLRVFSQIAAHDGGDINGFRLDYTFAEWRLGDTARLRFGMVRQPFGISGEVLDVGTLRPFYDLPQSVYGASGLTAISYKGVGILGDVPMGTWTLSYDAYFGGQSKKEFHPSEAYLRGDPITAEEATTLETNKDALGGRALFKPPIDGLSFGASGIFGSEMGDSRAKNRRTVYGLQAEYLARQWSIRSEYVNETVETFTDNTGWYIEVARRFLGHIQVAGQYGKLTFKWTGLDISKAPSFASHEEKAIGLNYWFSPSLVLKCSYHRVDGNRLAAPPADELVEIVNGGQLKTRTSLFRFGAQFSF